MIVNTFIVSVLLWSIKEIYPVPLQVVERADFSSKDQDDHKPVIPIIPPPKNDNVNIDSTNKEKTLNFDPSPLPKNDDSELEEFLSGLDTPVDSGTFSSHGGSLHTSNNFRNEHHVIKSVKESNIKNEQVENKMSSDNRKSDMNHNGEILQDTNNSDQHSYNGDFLQKDINNGDQHSSNGDSLQKDINNDYQHSSDGDSLPKDSDPKISNDNHNTNTFQKDINNSDIDNSHKDIDSNAPEKPIKVTNEIEKVFGPAPKDKNDNEDILKPLDNKDNELKDNFEETLGNGKKHTNIDQDKKPLDDVSIDHHSAVDSQPMGFFQRFLGDENHPLGYLGKEIKNVFGNILNGIQELTGLGPRRVGSGGIFGHSQISDGTGLYQKNMAEGRPPVGQGNWALRGEIRPTNNGMGEHNPLNERGTMGNEMVYGREQVGRGMGNMDSKMENIGRYPGIPNRGMGVMGNNGENVGRNPGGYNHGMEYMNVGMPPVYPGFNRAPPPGERRWNYPRHEGGMENSYQYEYFNGNMPWFRPKNGPGPGLLNSRDELAA